jgi:two-component system, NarL family, nitrate/nitrite response regulator NarL
VVSSSGTFSSAEVGAFGRAGRSARPCTDAGDRATSVVIVAPTRLCRDGLATVLANAGGLRIAAAVSDRRDELLGLGAIENAVIVVDAAAGMVATLPVVRSICLDCRIVVFGLSSDEDVLACARHDVSGYLDRSAGIDELIAAIARVSGGDLVCPPSVTSVLIRQVGTTPPAEPAPRRLTPRELEIITLLDEGLSNKQIAARLQIEVATVKNHVHNVLDKLDVKRRSQAARRCREADANLAFSYELARNQGGRRSARAGLV